MYYTVQEPTATGCSIVAFSCSEETVCSIGFNSSVGRPGLVEGNAQKESHKELRLGTLVFFDYYSGVARVKGVGEKEKGCTTECKSQRRLDETAPWELDDGSVKAGADESRLK